MVENMALEGSGSYGQAEFYRRGMFSIPIQLLSLAVIFDVSTCSGPVIGSGDIRTKERQPLSRRDYRSNHSHFPVVALTFYLRSLSTLFIVSWTYTA